MTSRRKIEHMYQIFGIGDVITGFCNGFFGRDDYSRKKCVMVTSEYAIFEYQDGTATVLNFDERIINSAECWKEKNEEISKTI